MSYQIHRLEPWITDPANIAANQRGFLTPKQLQWLATKKYASLRGKGCALIIIPGIIAIPIFGTIIYILLNGQALLSPGTPSAILTYSLFVLLPLALIGLGVLLRKRSSLQTKRFIEDVTTGKIVLSIEKRQGEVVWDMKRAEYIIHEPGQVSFPEKVARINVQRSLKPGPYHFYHVVEEGPLVAAQAIHSTTEMVCLPDTLAATGLSGDEQAQLAIQLALCGSADFTLDDLDTNRQGLLNNKQKHKNHQTVRRLEKRQQPIGVQSVEGEIEYREVSQDDGPNVGYFHIDKGRFMLSNVSARNALVNGIRYRIYFLAGTEILLSVEPLEAPRR